MAQWAGYTRVSRVGDRAERLLSPDLQAERIRAYAEGRGIEVVLLEPELDQSGGKRERPILTAALRGIEDGLYAGIVVAQIDRLSRMELVDALQTIRRVEDAGGQVIAVAENFDAGTPEGRMGRNVFLSVADMQLERYKRQFAQAKASAVERGVWPAPLPPLGYRVVRRRDGGDGRLHPDPEKRGVVVAGFEARARGAAWAEVAGGLGLGVAGARRLVLNRVYLGELRLGEWLNVNAHEPLVGVDLFEAAQLDHPRPPRGTHGPALLAGLVRCAGCRCVMSVERKPGKSRYRCRGRLAAGRCPAPATIGAKRVETYVERAALQAIERLGFTAAQRSRAVDRAAEELQAAEAELVVYQQATRVSDLGAEAFAAGMRTRQSAVEDARGVLAQARLASGPLPAPGTLRDLWPELSVAERRHVLRGTLGAVWVRRGKGTAPERVRLIAPGSEPTDLPRVGTRGVLRPLDWVEDLEGEIRVAGA